MIIYKCDKCGNEIPYSERYFVYANDVFNETLFLGTSEKLLCKNCAHKLYNWFEYSNNNTEK